MTTASRARQDNAALVASARQAIHDPQSLDYGDLHLAAVIERLDDVTVDYLRRLEELRGDVTLRDELIAALEDDKRELLEDGMRQAVTIARLEKTDTENKQRLCEAQRKAEDLTRDMAGALAEITELFSRARSIRLYDVDRARPLELTSQEAPRMAAAGGN
jgi:hypothetical protein